MVDRIEEDEVIQAAPRTELVLTRRFWELISGATPSIEQQTHLEFFSTSAITNFLDGQEAQTIKVLGDGASSVAHNANIKRNTAGQASAILLIDQVYTFTYKDAIWSEDC